MGSVFGHVHISAGVYVTVYATRGLWIFGGHCVSVVEKGGCVSACLLPILIRRFFAPRSSCQSGFCVALDVNVSPPCPYSMLLYGKAELKMMTQGYFVSPWSPGLTHGGVIIIDLCDIHTAPLRTNAS